MRFTLDVLNDREVAAGLSSLGERAVQARPVLEAASGVLAAGLARNFQSHGAALGAPWTAKKDGSSASLVDSGGLAAALTGGPGGFKRQTATTAFAGVRGDRAFIARFHQGGTSRGLPARKVVGVSERDEGVLLAMVQRYLLEDLS